jgi:hypothetical protein
MRARARGGSRTRTARCSGSSCTTTASPRTSTTSCPTVFASTGLLPRLPRGSTSRRRGMSSCRTTRSSSRQLSPPAPLCSRSAASFWTSRFRPRPRVMLPTGGSRRAGATGLPAAARRDCAASQAAASGRRRQESAASDRPLVVLALYRPVSALRQSSRGLSLALSLLLVVAYQSRCGLLQSDASQQDRNVYMVSYIYPWRLPGA